MNWKKFRQQVLAPLCRGFVMIAEGWGILLWCLWWCTKRLWKLACHKAFVPTWYVLANFWRQKIMPVYRKKIQAMLAFNQGYVTPAWRVFVQVITPLGWFLDAILSSVLTNLEDEERARNPILRWVHGLPEPTSVTTSHHSS